MLIPIQYVTIFLLFCQFFIMEEEKEVMAGVIVSINFFKRRRCGRFQNVGLLFPIDHSNDGIVMFSGVAK